MRCVRFDTISQYIRHPSIHPFGARSACSCPRARVSARSVCPESCLFCVRGARRALALAAPRIFVHAHYPDRAEWPAAIPSFAPLPFFGPFVHSLWRRRRRQAAATAKPHQLHPPLCLPLQSTNQFADCRSGASTPTNFHFSHPIIYIIFQT